MKTETKRYIEASRKFLHDAHELSSARAKKAFLHLAQHAAERARVLRELEMCAAHSDSEKENAVLDMFQLEEDLEGLQVSGNKGDTY